MLSIEKIRKKFYSLREYEEWYIKWIRTCSRINKSGKNGEILKEAEKRWRKQNEEQKANK